MAGNGTAVTERCGVARRRGSGIAKMRRSRFGSAGATGVNRLAEETHGAGTSIEAVGKSIAGFGLEGELRINVAVMRRSC